MYNFQAIATIGTQGGRKREKNIHHTKEEEKHFCVSSLMKVSLLIKRCLCFTLKFNCSD